MYSPAIRNILHKQNESEINILYYPNNDLIDDFITDWNFNFFVPGLSIVSKPNVINTNNSSLFEYDFILAHEPNDFIRSLSNNLHIPIVLYLKYGSYDSDKLIKHDNVFYIIEQIHNTKNYNAINIMPFIKDFNIEKTENKICLFVDTNTNYQQVAQHISRYLPDLSVVDQSKITKKAMVEILSKHKICIDLYPTNMYKLLMCGQANVAYITIKNGLSEFFKSIYDGVFEITTIEQIFDICNQIKDGKFLLNFGDYSNHEHLVSFLTRIKRSGYIL